MRRSVVPGKVVCAMMVEEKVGCRPNGRVCVRPDRCRGTACRAPYGFLLRAGILFERPEPFLQLLKL